MTQDEPQIHIHYADGNFLRRPFPPVFDGQPAPLKYLQDVVEGFIEFVPCIYGEKSTTMVVNEDGISKGLKLNLRATKIYHETLAKRTGIALDKASSIYGNAVLLVNVEVE
jgi:hypothetical protein